MSQERMGARGKDASRAQALPKPLVYAQQCIFDMALFVDFLFQKPWVDTKGRKFLAQGRLKSTETISDSANGRVICARVRTCNTCFVAGGCLRYCR